MICGGNREVFREHVRGLVDNTETYSFERDVKLIEGLILKPFIRNERFRFTTTFAREVFLKMTADYPNLESASFKPWWVPLLRFYWTAYSILGRLEAEANWFEIVRNEAENSSTAVS